jgi:hypothetical protein
VAARHHRSERGVREPHERHDVEADLARLVLDVELVEQPVAAEARVVHERVDRAGRIGETRLDARERARVGEVGREHLGGDVVLRTQLRRDLLQPLLVARDQHDVVAAPRELDRERVADARRRAGHECGRH